MREIYWQNKFGQKMMAVPKIKYEKFILYDVCILRDGIWQFLYRECFR